MISYYIFEPMGLVIHDVRCILVHFGQAGVPPLPVVDGLCISCIEDRVHRKAYAYRKCCLAWRYQKDAQQTLVQEQ